MSIAENYLKIREEVPDAVAIVLAAKTQTLENIAEAIKAGATDIGESYVQEAENVHQTLGETAGSVRWHMIGHLQRNKVNRVLSCIDVIQTVDSFKLAEAIESRVDRPYPVYIEINSGREPMKSGIMPEKAEDLLRRIADLNNVRVEGLMTMGPRFGDPEDARPYFRETRKLFDHIDSLDMPHVEMRVLSMGMSNAYRVAIEEGSTMIRPGSIVFRNQLE